jgi:hypothetical protein
VNDPVFVVALNAAGKPTCQMAQLVAKKGAWWHIQHADGSVTRHNGGFIGRGPRAYTGRIPNSIGSRYETSMVAAYERAITDLVHAAWAVGYHQETSGAVERLSATARDMVFDLCEQMREMGKLEAVLDAACDDGVKKG